MQTNISAPKTADGLLEYIADRFSNSSYAVSISFKMIIVDPNADTELIGPKIS